MKIPGMPDGLDFGEMMRQAQEMQEKLQTEVKDIKVDATAGGGMVTVTMSGNKEVLDVKIDPQMLKDGDVDMLQDLLMASFNEASRKVDEKLRGKLGAMLPPGLGGF